MVKMVNKPISDQKRWQIVAYKKLKFSYRCIAALCFVSPKCVSTTLKNYGLTGGDKDKQRTGRPKTTSPRDDRELLRMVRDSPKLSLR